MGKTRPIASKGTRKSKKRNALGTSSPAQPEPPANAPALMSLAAALLQSGEPESALPLAKRAFALLSHPAEQPGGIAALPALSLLGEINIELGEPGAAREAFEKAVELDPGGFVPDMEGGGAEKFLWLAQLSENGGAESIGWYERGVKVLERSVETFEGQKGHEEELENQRSKLQAALCSMIEVWMTDLSLESEAEANCESLIAKALSVSVTSNPSTLQTLASIRLSQARLEDAQSALNQSLSQWQDLPPGHAGVPDFPLRISLARLLMEAEMEDVALEIVERLVGEDDESVEAWYLGGWCLWLMASKACVEDAAEKDENRVLSMSSREWLRNCLKLCSLLDYEDERLKEHAQELVNGLDQMLGDAEIEDDDEEGWEEEEDEEDEEDEGDEEEEDDKEKIDEDKSVINPDHEMNGT